MLALLVVLAQAEPPYWQQRVSYEIVAALDEPSGVLSGRARIVYVNASPDTLHDFYVHQYLNAFRPGSRWAAADSAEGRVRFQRLADPDYAFERITRSVIGGSERQPDYPFAPDSTIAHWSLARPLAPGDSLVAEIDWRARPSTLPRRQGRQGRRFDFAQWYPKVVVYDRLGWQAHPLYPAGEFYGEFATYDVTLEVAEDQVIGATGVPVDGDPGWQRARADITTIIDYQRDWYGPRPHTAHAPTSPRPQGLWGCGGVGRKCVRWYAEDVHHFAFSLNPEYRYEEGRFEDVVVRVLYLPEDSATWGKGIVVQRTAGALLWLDALFGDFAWPQLTNVHRIEGGGTEFPMLVMNGGPSMGLIVHEVGHNYTMGILANNEWREGWLDEGFTSFQAGLFNEATAGRPAYPGVESNILSWDMDGWSEPVSTVSEHFRDFGTYGTMIYSKGQLFFEQLRYVVGDDAMRRILRTFYERWKLKHVDEHAFRQVAEEESKQDLGWLFAQWLHDTPLIDYALRKVERNELQDGRWRTVVTVERLGDGWMPLEIADERTTYARTTGQSQLERVEFTSAERPGRLRLDPRVRGHDWNMLNNSECKGWSLGRRGCGKTDSRVDNPFSERAHRDRLVSAFMPVAWSNDWGGLTLGVRSRTNYLGRYEERLGLLTYGTRDGATKPLGVYARFGNPVSDTPVRSDVSMAFWYVEGRAGLALAGERSLRRSRTLGADKRAGGSLLWMATTDLEYLDPELWEDAGSVEATAWFSTTSPTSDVWRARISATAGLVYWVPGAGIVSENRYDVEPFARVSVDAAVRKPFIARTTLRARIYGGVYVATSRPPLQRRINVAGADPYETFENPFLRSKGALFVRPDVHYHAPGGANLRGFDRSLGGRWAASVNLEVAKSITSKDQGFLRDVSLYGFVDAGLVDSMAVSSSSAGDWYTPLYDGGVGISSDQTLGDLDWTMRLEFPLAVNRWNAAADPSVDDSGRLAFRWQVSLQPSF